MIVCIRLHVLPVGLVYHVYLLGSSMSAIDNQSLYTQSERVQIIEITLKHTFVRLNSEREYTAKILLIAHTSAR